MWGPYKKGNFDLNMNIGRTLCEGEGRDQGAASISQKISRLPANHKKLGERHGQILLRALRRNQPCGYFDLGCLALEL